MVEIHLKILGLTEILVEIGADCDLGNDFSLSADSATFLATPSPLAQNFASQHEQDLYSLLLLAS